MSYRHAERALALIRQLEAEATQLSGNQILPGQEQLPEPAGPGGNAISPQIFRTASSAIGSHSRISNTE
jgi:hypothetical protein